MPKMLCSVLSIKSDIGIRVKQNYDNRNVEGLRELASKMLPEIYDRVESLRLAHRKQWMDTYNQLDGKYWTFDMGECLQD